MIVQQKKFEAFIRAWLDSLAIFKPENLKLFLLITCNTIFQTYKKFSLLFFPLIMIWALVEFLYFSNFYFSGLPIILNLLRYGLFFLLLLTIRPSIGIKNYTYYISYLGYGIFYGILILLLSFLYIPFLHSLMGYLLLIPQEAFYCSPFILFILFFYLDSDGGISGALKSIYRAFIMFVYNYPFCLITFFVAVTLLHLFYSIIFLLLLFISRPWIAHYVAYIISTLFIPVIVGFIGNFYIKRVYDQITLYVTGCK